MAADIVSTNETAEVIPTNTKHTKNRTPNIFPHDPMIDHHPNHLNFLLALANEIGVAPPNLCPIPYSNIKRGIPAVNIAK